MSCKIDKCPLCGGKGANVKYKWNFAHLLECKCGFAYLDRHPSTEELNTLYSADYYASWGFAGEEGITLGAMKKRTFSKHLSKIHEHAEIGKILDVGCATGFFLEVAKNEGWDVYGVELSKFAANLARKKLGASIFNGFLEDSNFDNDFFDIITLFDLLEHVPSPHSFLSEVHRILKPGGKLLIVTPDMGSLSSTIMGKKWSHYKDEHLYYFSRETIKLMLQKNGFYPLSTKAALKYLSLRYIVGQFSVYKHPLITPLLKGIEKLMPNFMNDINIPLYCGEIIVISQKEE